MSLGCILEGFYIFDLFYLPSKNQIKYIYIYNRPHLRSRATSGRTRFLWEGDLRFAFVREGNGLASRVALMCLLSSCMGLIWMIEQPRQSILEAHRRIDLLWKSIFAYKTSWWMGCFNGPTAKPHYLICNMLPFIRGMETFTLWNHFLFLCLTCFLLPLWLSLYFCSWVLWTDLQSKEGRAGYLPKSEREKLTGKPLVIKKNGKYTGDRPALRDSQCLVSNPDFQNHAKTYFPFFFTPKIDVFNWFVSFPTYTMG